MAFSDRPGCSAVVMLITRFLPVAFHGFRPSIFLFSRSPSLLTLTIISLSVNLATRRTILPRALNGLWIYPIVAAELRIHQYVMFPCFVRVRGAEG